MSVNSLPDQFTGFHPGQICYQTFVFAVVLSTHCSKVLKPFYAFIFNLHITTQFNILVCSALKTPWRPLLAKSTLRSNNKKIRSCSEYRRPAEACRCVSAWLPTCLSFHQVACSINFLIQFCWDKTRQIYQQTPAYHVNYPHIVWQSA